MILRKTIFCGKSRRKVEKIIFIMGKVTRLADFDYSVKVEVDSSLLSCNKNLRAVSEFDCVNTVMAFFRQSIRGLIQEDSKLRFYEEIHGGKLLELSINEIFGTQDCVPQDLQIAYEWAKKNGYQSK